MTKIIFEQDDSLDFDEVILSISAKKLSTEVHSLLDLLNNIPSKNHPTKSIPLLTKEQVMMVSILEIVAVEVVDQQLSVHTAQHSYLVRERLKNFLARLNDTAFLQISRSVAINIDQLQALEAEFSGNMTAKMIDGRTLIVSRSYVPDLKRRLGL